MTFLSESKLYFYNFSEMPKLSQFQRAAIIGELQRGKMKAAIAMEMGVTKSCVTKIARKVARLGPERSLKNSKSGGKSGGSHKVLEGAGALVTCSSHL